MLLSTIQTLSFSACLHRLLNAGNFLVVALCFAVSSQALAQDVAVDPALDPKVYDLNSRHGVLTVYQRVQTIAEQHCVANSSLAKPLNSAELACRDRILGELLGKLADPYLSYLHENPSEQRVAKR